MPAFTLDDASLDALKAFRRELHQYPFASDEEAPTVQRLVTFLQPRISTEIRVFMNGTAALVAFDSGQPGPGVLLRGDTDALPIPEVNTFAHASKRPGYGHMCGHDGHTAILCAVAAHLNAHPPKQGCVVLLFQPAEENGHGAVGVLNSGILKDYPITHAYALHNLPGFPLHHVASRNGTFNAAVKSVIYRFEGITAHAAEPEQGRNPALAMAALLQEAEAASLNTPDSDDFFIAVPVYTTLGQQAYGIAAGVGEVHLTVRSWKPEILSDKLAALEAFAHKQADAHELQLSLRETESFEACDNAAENVAVIAQASSAAGLSFTYLERPFRWGEDFGLFSQYYSGAMFGLGSGEDCPALHNPDYDFPDALIASGARVFVEVLRAHWMA